MLHIFNNLALPVSWAGSRSYIVWSGVQDAMMQWWYGHNAVAFFLTAGFLGMLYYYLPKRAERPIYSYRLSILSFWGIVFFYVWVGSHHLHYTALPQWVQTLGMTFSVMLLVPAVAAILCLFVSANAARSTALIATLIDFALGVVLWTSFDVGGAQWQFVERPALGDFGLFQYALGIDGFAKRVLS